MISTKVLIGLLTLAKAYYIVSVFMHLGDEIRNFIMTIVIPLLLFVWFIIAFLADGNSWRNMRNTEAGSKVSTEPVSYTHLDVYKRQMYSPVPLEVMGTYWHFVDLLWVYLLLFLLMIR